MSETKTTQGSRVAAELEVLRQKQLANKQRDKLKNRTYLLYSFFYVVSCISVLTPSYLIYHLSMLASYHSGRGTGLFSFHARQESSTGILTSTAVPLDVRWHRFLAHATTSARTGTA